MDNCYNIKDIFNDMFIDIVDIKYFWIFNIVNLIGVIICWVISYNNEEKIVPILITIFFIASIIYDFTDDIYFYTVNGFCLALIVAYIIYVYINKKEIMIPSKTYPEYIPRSSRDTDTDQFYPEPADENDNKFLKDLKDL
jgi:hypothetical protein